MAVAIQISPNDSLFIKDPQASSTGRNILNHAIPLMQEIGFEKFTFRKLAERMGASEITVYRYFENKHKLLLYLLSWYWEWVKYSISFNTRNIEDPEEKLRLAIRTVIDSSKRNTLVDYIDEEKLYELVVEESEKAYHTKQVDEENKMGLFLTLKSLKAELSAILLEINPNYPYPNSLASTILEMSASLRFYANHLPSMTDIKELSNIDKDLADYIESLVFAALNK
jgi:AcrR family transcriptional regulator